MSEAMSLPSLGLLFRNSASNSSSNPAPLPPLGLLGGFSPASGVLPTITTTTLSNVVALSSGSTQLTATGDLPQTWNIVSGSLPSWLSLSPSGLLTWTIAEPSYTSFTVSATNLFGNDTQALTLTVPNEVDNGGEVVVEGIDISFVEMSDTFSASVSSVLLPEISVSFVENTDVFSALLNNPQGSPDYPRGSRRATNKRQADTSFIRFDDFEEDPFFDAEWEEFIDPLRNI